MENNATTSISKGCFVIPKEGKSTPFSANDYLCDHDLNTSQRWELGKKIWRNVEISVNKIHAEIQENLVEDLVAYIKSAQGEIDPEKLGRRVEIPTAALITGVNMTDHDALFCHLQEYIKENVSPYIAMLKAKHCTNMKSLMRTIGDQLMLETEGKNEDYNQKEDHFLHLKKKSTPLTMSMIEKWYSKVIVSNQLPSSPSKKPKINNFSILKPPIVVIFQDLEGFSQKLLHDFILMSSFHSHKVPLVFVFGVATSWPDVSQRLIPHSAIVHISVEKFHAPSASSHLALIIDKILLTSEHPFKLGGKCFQLLLDVFLCHDFSIANFLYTLKYCMLEHFYDQPASILCTSTLRESFDTISNLDKSGIKSLRLVESLKKHISSLNQTEQDLLKDLKHFKMIVKKLIEDLHNYHECYFPVLRSLHAFSASLPQYPMGKQIRELYCSCFRAELANSEGYKQAFTLLKVSSRDQLIERLRCAVIPLEDSKFSKISSSDHLHISTCCSKLHSFMESLKAIGENDMEDNNNDEQEPEEEQLETVKYAYQLKERLRQKAKRKRMRKLTKYEKFREDSLGYLREFYEYHLRRVKTLPLHEAFYFDSYSKVKSQIVPSPRLAIQTALSDPYQYLKVPEFENMASGVIPPNAPDICIAYKLHNESGSIINLFDWMSAFHTVVTSQGKDDDTEEEEEASEEIDEVTQARFIRAVSELQLLGFIKPTNRKTDHVQRLTWSHM